MSTRLRGPQASIRIYRSLSKAVKTERPLNTQKKIHEFRRLLGLASPEKWRLAGAVGLLVVSSGVTMTVPFALGRVIDIIYNLDQCKNISKCNNTDADNEAEKKNQLNNQQFPETFSQLEDRKNETENDVEKQKEAIKANLRRVCGVLVGVFVTGAVANFGRVYLMRIVSQRVTARLRNAVFSSIVRQEVAFFDRTKTGELVNRLSSDSLVVSQAISTQISDGLRSTFMTTAGIGMMFYMSPQLAFVSLGVVPPVALWGVWMGRKVRAASRTVQDSLAQATQVAEERISNIRTVRAFATEEREILRYDQEMQNILSKSQREALVQAKFFGMVCLISTAVNFM